MRQKGLLPDMFTTNMILNGFCKQGRMKAAIDLFMDMQRTGLSPDIVTYNTLIGGCCKAFDMVTADEL
ncbi:pentatricopeptide repeat-containing protein [Quercus suber]|uniref:Pentatricopeptide repeat-containing protein n=1 Tax=Quercus suber TaxID=58331 RepID=A0AAW0KXY4_QUESU